MALMFKPRFPQFDWALSLALLVGGTLLCYVVEVSWWSYALTIGSGLATLGWLFLSKRRMQLHQYGLLKLRGIRIAWNHGNIQERMDSDEFAALFESKMADPAWRQSVLKIIGSAKWIGVTDHFTNPYTFRWELYGTPPQSWDDDARFCLYIACMCCLPEWHPYQIQIDKGHFILKNGAAYTSQIPRVYTDAPAITLQFWSYFQKHMAILMDDRLEFNIPSFQTGLAQDVDIAVPSRFDLAEGGSLNVAKEGSIYCVVVLSNTGEMGPTQRYSSANDFWWVWRNAIEHKSLN